MGPQRMYGLTPWVRRLLVANLLVFLVQSTLFTNPDYSNAFAFSPQTAWEHPWTFVTYMFLHAGIFHLVLNMLMLFFFGASVAVLGVAVAFAWYWPDDAVLIFPLPDPIAAKWLVTFLIGLDLALALIGATDGIAHIAHLGGVATALLYLKGQDWRATRGERHGRHPPESSVLVSQPPRVSRSGAIPPSAQRTRSRSEPDARANAEIDRVLDKIIASGVDSLTPAERKFLTEISRRLRTPPKA